MSASDILFLILIGLSSAFVLGIAAGWSLAKQQVAKTQAVRRDLVAEMRNPVDASFEVIARGSGAA